MITNIEAVIGKCQINKYAKIIETHQACAPYYDAALQRIEAIQLPPLVAGATYSHYPIQIANRDDFLDYGIQHGIQFGTIIDYSIPHIATYKRYAQSNTDYAVSHTFSKSVINLPVWSLQHTKQIVDCVNNYFSTTKEKTCKQDQLLDT